MKRVLCIKLMRLGLATVVLLAGAVVAGLLDIYVEVTNAALVASRLVLALVEEIPTHT